MKTLNRFFLGLLLLGWILFSLACSIRSEGYRNTGSDLIVFAAASLTDAFTELARAFEHQHPGTSVVLNFAASSQLAAQLREGVAADVFASANPNQMQAAIDSGRVLPEDVFLFAANQLTIVVPADNPGQVSSVVDLGNPGLSLLMAVQGVPVRDYADMIIKTLPESTQKHIYANLVSEESTVRQIATKIALGEADAGIVYTSDITPEIAGRVELIRIPDEENIIATYPIAVIAESGDRQAAVAFVTFVHSPTAQKILAKWGFLPSPFSDNGP
jgi:molybdate transport system substrate-binding protein